jgi:hypothetical protein
LLIAPKTQSKILKYNNNFHFGHDRPTTKIFASNDKYLFNQGAGAFQHGGVNAVPALPGNHCLTRTLVAAAKQVRP